MMRAVALAARLDFTHRSAGARRDPSDTATRSRRARRRGCSRSTTRFCAPGSSEKAFRELADVGLLEPISAELHDGAAESLWQSLAALDAYRRRFESTPDTLHERDPAGQPARAARLCSVPRGRRRPSTTAIVEAVERPRQRHGGHAVGTNGKRTELRLGPRLGELPLARRDIERLRQILGLQRRLRDLTASPRAQRALDAPQHLSRSADVAGDSRRRAGDRSSTGRCCSPSGRAPPYAGERRTTGDADRVQTPAPPTGRSARAAAPADSVVGQIGGRRRDQRIAVPAPRQRRSLRSSCTAWRA